MKTEGIMCLVDKRSEDDKNVCLMDEGEGCQELPVHKGVSRFV